MDNSSGKHSTNKAEQASDCSSTSTSSNTGAESQSKHKTKKEKEHKKREHRKHTKSNHKQTTTSTKSPSPACEMSEAALRVDEESESTPQPERKVRSEIEAFTCSPDSVNRETLEERGVRDIEHLERETNTTEKEGLVKQNALALREVVDTGKSESEQTTDNENRLITQTKITEVDDTGNPRTKKWAEKHTSFDHEDVGESGSPETTQTPTGQVAQEALNTKEKDGSRSAQATERTTEENGLIKQQIFDRNVTGDTGNADTKDMFELKQQERLNKSTFSDTGSIQIDETSTEVQGLENQETFYQEEAKKERDEKFSLLFVKAATHTTDSHALADDQPKPNEDNGGTPSFVDEHGVSTEETCTYNDADMSTPLQFVHADSTPPSDKETPAAVGKIPVLAGKISSFSEDIGVLGTEEMLAAFDQTAVFTDQNTLPVHQTYAKLSDVPSPAEETPVPINSCMQTATDTLQEVQVTGTRHTEASLLNAYADDVVFEGAENQKITKITRKQDLDKKGGEGLENEDGTTNEIRSFDVVEELSNKTPPPDVPQAAMGDVSDDHRDDVSVAKTSTAAIQVEATPQYQQTPPPDVPQAAIGDVSYARRDDISVETTSTSATEVEATPLYQQTTLPFQENISDKEVNVFLHDEESMSTADNTFSATGDTFCVKTMASSFIKATSQIPVAAEGAASAAEKIKLPAEGSLFHDSTYQSVTGETAPYLDKQASLADGATQPVQAKPPCNVETHIAFDTDESSSYIRQPPPEETPRGCTGTVGDLERTELSETRPWLELSSTVNGDSKDTNGFRTGVPKACGATTLQERKSAPETPGGKVSKQKKKNKGNKQKAKTRTNTDPSDNGRTAGADAARSHGTVETQSGHKDGKREKNTKTMTDTTTTGRTKGVGIAANVRLRTETETTTSNNTDLSDPWKAAAATTTESEGTFQIARGKKHRKREEAGGKEEVGGSEEVGGWPNAEQAVKEEVEDLGAQYTAERDDGEFVEHAEYTPESGETVETSGLNDLQERCPEGHVTTRQHSTTPTYSTDRMYKEDAEPTDTPFLMSEDKADPTLEMRTDTLPHTATHQCIDSLERTEETLSPADSTPNEAGRRGDGDSHTHMPRPSAGRSLEKQSQSPLPETQDDVVNSARDAQEKQTTVRKQESEGNLVVTPRKPVPGPPTFASTPKPNQNCKTGNSLTDIEATSPSRGEDQGNQGRMLALQQAMSVRDAQVQDLHQQLSEKGDEIRQLRQTNLELRSHQDEVTNLQRQLTDLSRTYNHLVTHNSELSETVHKLREEEQLKNIDVQCLSRRLTQESTNKEDTVKKLEALQRELNVKDNVIREAKEEKDRLEKQLQNREQSMMDPNATHDRAAIASTPNPNQDSESRSSQTVQMLELQQALFVRDVEVWNLQQQLLVQEDEIKQLQEIAKKIGALQREVNARDVAIREAEEKMDRLNEETANKLGALQREVNAKDVAIREAEEKMDRLNEETAKKLGALQREVNAKDVAIREAEEKMDRLNEETAKKLEALQREVNAKDDAKMDKLKKETVKKLVTLKREVNAKDDTIREAEEELEKLKRSHQDEVTKLQKELAGLTHSCRQLETQNSQLSDTVRTMRDEEQQKNRDIQCLTRRLAQESDDKEETVKKLEALQCEVNAKDNAIRAAEEEKDRLKKEPDTLRRELQNREQSMMELKASHDRAARSHEDVVTKLEGQVVDLSRTCDQLKTQNSQLSDTVHTLRQEEQLHLRDVQRLTRTITQESSEKDSAMAAKEKLESDIEQLTAERDDLKESAKATATQLEELQSANNDLENRLDQMAGQLTRLQTRRILWKIIARKLRFVLAELQGNHDAAEKALSEQQDSLKAALNKIAEVTAKCTHEKQQLDAQHRVSLDRLQQDVARQTESVGQLEEEKASLSGEVSSLGERLEREQELRSEYETENGNLHGQLAELTSDQRRKDDLIISLSQSLNKEKSEKEKAQALTHQQASTVAILTAENTSSKDTVAECRQQLASYKAQRLLWKFLAVKHGRSIRSMEATLQGLQQDLKNERDANESRTQTLRDALNKTESTRVLLATEQRKFQEMESKTAQQRDTITRLEAEVKRQKDFVQNVTGEKEKLANERRQLGEMITSLESQAKQSREEKERAILEKKVVDEENKSLKDRLTTLNQQWQALQRQTADAQTAQFTAQLSAKERELAATAASKDAQISELAARVRQLQEERRPMEMEAERVTELQDTAKQIKELNQQLERSNAALHNELSTKTIEVAALELEQQRLRERLNENELQMHRYTQEYQAARDQLLIIMAEKQRLQLKLETQNQGGRR